MCRSKILLTKKAHYALRNTSTAAEYQSLTEIAAHEFKQLHAEIQKEPCIRETHSKNKIA